MHRVLQVRRLTTAARPTLDRFPVVAASADLRSCLHRGAEPVRQARGFPALDRLPSDHRQASLRLAENRIQRRAAVVVLERHYHRVRRLGFRQG